MGVVIYNHPKLVARWADRVEHLTTIFGSHVAGEFIHRDMRLDSVQFVLLNRELERRERERSKL
jgi:hypothetical protein